ncbi:tRNA 2'-phosphotransferase 1-like [Mangifera indica]|uniref:tRNA 2'-phosphotransferase 1-like n=1 Tax=Mangifera indica TaxID=29780 RepID=UPI001CFBACE1|nr:tRNA 2'-phosphotransferase 1-like [Mangifera indica]
MALELNLNVQSDGYVRVQDLLKLNMRTFAQIPLRSHTVDDIREKYLESILESRLKRVKRLNVHFLSGLPTDGEVISGMRRDVNVLIFLDIRKALGGGMKLDMSNNRVILTEGFDGVVPVKYFEKLESWPDRRPIPL